MDLRKSQKDWGNWGFEPQRTGEIGVLNPNLYIYVYVYIYIYIYIYTFTYMYVYVYELGVLIREGGVVWVGS